MDPPPPPIGNAAIRSRVTVVCTECKRLKLKCDRRAPCGSCIKRGTALKCQYSVEARDKIDVQTLHNRILVIENTLQMQQQPPASAEGRGTAARPTLAAGQLFVSIDDASALWIDQLQLVPADLAPADDAAAGRAGPDLPDPALFASAGAGAGLPAALLDALPPHDMRPHLLDALDDVLRLHSALHAAHLKTRMLALFDPAPPHPPSWSFVALACAAWAIGSQTWLGSHHSERLDSPWAYDPDRLIDLSEHALIVYDRTRRDAACDPDYVQALLLQMLFRLNDGAPRVHSTVYPALHKAVAAARSIGLGVDPGDTPGRFSLFEAETRRRVWWDLLYFDLFVSEALGHPHIIPDGSFSTTLPAECDDLQFDVHSNALPPLSNSEAGRDNSFIVLRCRLVQLFKGIKHRMSGEPNSELSLETAQSCQADLQEWLSDVPPQLRFEPTYSESPSPVSPDEHAPGPVTLAQRAALVLLVQARVLQLFLPLAAARKAAATPAHFAIVSAAHAVVGAARHLLPGRVPHYVFARAAFGGAVACAVELLRDPAALLAVPAREAVTDALALFCAADGAAARVLRALLAKGRGLRRGPKAGEKRKRGAEDGAVDAEDVEEMAPGTVLPFLGPAICVARPAPTSPPPPAVPREREREREKEKERDPKPRPQLAIRVRPDNAGKVKTEPGTPIVAPARREPVPIRPTPPSHAKPPQAQAQQQQRKAPLPQPPPPPPIPPPSVVYGATSAAAYVEGVPPPRRSSVVPMDTGPPPPPLPLPPPAPPPMDAYVSYADAPTTTTATSAGPGMYAASYGPPPYAPYYYMPPPPEAMMYDVQMRGGGGEMMDVSGGGGGGGGGERAGSSASESSGAPPPRVWNTTDNTRFSRWTFDDQGWRETGEPEPPS